MLVFGVMVLAVLFVFLNAGFDFAYVIPQRLVRLASIVLGGICIAFSSIIFQTLVGHRILTPSLMGYEAVYLLCQGLVFFFFFPFLFFW